VFIFSSSSSFDHLDTIVARSSSSSSSFNDLNYAFDISATATMEELPTESLVKIFNQVEPRDLLSVSEASKKLNQVINDFMPVKFPSIRVDFRFLNYSKVQKFTYKDDSGRVRDFNVLLQTHRHYQNYILLNFNKEHTDRLRGKWAQLFKKQMNARCIRIKSDCLDLQQLKNLIKLTHRIVYLEIDGYRTARNEEPLDSSAIPNLPSLKHLKIHSFLDTSMELFKIFENCRTLKTLSMSNLMMVNKKIKSINDFICQQRALEQLEIIGVDTHNALFSDDSLRDIKFKLKKLNIEYSGHSFNLARFSEFFAQQKELKEVKLALDLRNTLHHAEDARLCDEILRHIMTLERLTTLDLTVNKIALKNAEEEFSFCNKRVTKLVYENETRDGRNELLVGLLKSFPNLRHLELACEFTDNVLQQLPQLNKLKHLKLTDYYQGLLSTVQCAAALESISVQYCYTRHSGSDWHTFLQNNPNIRKIHVHHSIDFIDDAICDIITGALPRLEYFNMTDSSAGGLTENAYRIFDRNCKHLKFLKLTEKPCNKTQNKHQSFHDLLADVKCVICFYVICIVGFILLIYLMWQGAI